MKFNLNIIEWNADLYSVIRTIKVDSKPIISTWKSHLRVDTVLKRSGFYFFCNKIEDAQIVTDIENSSEEDKNEGNDK